MKLHSSSSSSIPSDDSTTITKEDNDTNKKIVEDIKNSILKAALLSGRGVWSRPKESSETKDLISKLEQETSENKLQDGCWELVLSDIEPFRASIFFLALASAVEANLIPNAADNALTVHSLATGGGEIGRVAHIVEQSVLHSLVELRSGSLPSLPLALTGTVVSSGELLTSKNDASSYDLLLRNTTVQGNQMKYGLPQEGGLKPFVNNDMLSWIGDQVVPSGDIFSSVLDPLGGGQDVRMKVTYADNDMMVWRTPDLPGDHYFCFVKGDRANWPEFDDMKTRQQKNNAASSPIGSAFALGMLNPFF
eukprot:CAMPEP_0194178270 /NCGR_PEP_ID=MMETSP0154-20130528/11909_1 /TAXON_ID=1049557 /ORGANISM="Thalassiothrix antarctica, Strain L6-D1" /LENGTH=306 /DNA_ID=CAMNT_0038893167 /DNA_START=142 /DNA_END=1059 /DNA_ORIENTATION=-